MRIIPLHVIKAALSSSLQACWRPQGSFSRLSARLCGLQLLHNTRWEEQPKFRNTLLRAGNGKIYTASARGYTTHTHTYVHIYTYTVVNSRSCQTGMHGWSVGGEIKSYFTACSSSRKQERGFDL